VPKLDEGGNLNLYVDAAFPAELAALGAYLSAKTGVSFSPSRAAMRAVRNSPDFKAMLRKQPAHSKTSGGKMSLSQAIRRGTRLHSQAGPHVVFEYEPPGNKNNPVRSTALGAAWAGVGFEPQHYLTVDLMEAFPILGRKLGNACPVGVDCGSCRTLEVLIIHLEKQHDWKREQVIDWLRGQGL
jgi:hypothetical protein